MPSSFSSLRSNRKSLLDKLAQEAKKESQKGGADDRFWKLSVDQKSKVGYAVIRFLPAPQGEDIPWARVFSHGFQVAGGWFIENCPTTLGGTTCPVCADNNRLWNSGIESDKDIARARKRKLSFISNILVINDPAHPENNGKVFLFRYGSKIHDKIKELIEPQFPDQAPANPFDLWEGCDFKLKSQLVGGFQNYDKSAFSDASELFEGDDDKKEEVWKLAKPLAEFIDPKQFKSYEELEKRFNKMLSGPARGPKTAEEAVKATPSIEDAEEVAEAIEEEKPKAKPRTKAAPKAEAPVAAPDDEDDIKKFFGGIDSDDE